MTFYIDEFRKITENISHGNSTFFDHCYNVYKILKKIGCEEFICKAGLFHSVYDTDYFTAGLNASRLTITDLIGHDAEELAFIFCNLKNRYNNILHNNLNFCAEKDLALSLIEYANLKEQSDRLNDPHLIAQCNSLLEKITTIRNITPYFPIDNKKVYVLDDLISNTHIEFINQFCNNSVYKPNHSSGNSIAESDSRFSCTMSKQEFEYAGLIPVMRKIAQIFNEPLFIADHYINHYTQMTGVSKHVDSSFPNHYTVLIFPNNYWIESWGGEIAFYKEKNMHNLVNYKPGRVIVFDSRIPHKVLPINREAKIDRYSIAVKTSLEEGKAHITNIDNYVKVEP